MVACAKKDVGAGMSCSINRISFSRSLLKKVSI
jgi:hypothetical protein